jgi:hypothetical protein
MNINGVAVLIVGTVIGGCTTTSVIPMSQDMVQINTSAAPACGSTGAQEVAVRQAAKETLRRGYDRFIILGGQYGNNIGVVGYTPTIVQSAGATTTVSGGYPIIAGRHNQALMVKMFRDGDPAAANALPARETLGSNWQELVRNDAVTCF